jgi:hypothetical protein
MQSTPNLAFDPEYVTATACSWPFHGDMLEVDIDDPALKERLVLLFGFSMEQKERSLPPDRIPLESRWSSLAS